MYPFANEPESALKRQIKYLLCSNLAAWKLHLYRGTCSAKRNVLTRTHPLMMWNVIDSNTQHLQKKPFLTSAVPLKESVAIFNLGVTGGIMKKVPCRWQSIPAPSAGWKIYCNKKPSTAGASLKLVSGVQKGVLGEHRVISLFVTDGLINALGVRAGRNFTLERGWSASLLHETQKRCADQSH